MPDPFVSVIIPVRNAQKFIVQTLDSILAERGVSLEIVAVDDCSAMRDVHVVVVDY